MILFDAIAQKLNFTYEIILPPDGEGVGGTKSKRNTKRTRGLLGMVMDKEVDISFCGIWQGSMKAFSGFLITSPVHEICFKYLVQRPLPLSQMGLGLFHSFELKVWVLIFIGIVIAAIFLQVTAFMTAKMYGHSRYKLRKFMKPINSVLQLWSTLCGDAPDSLAIFGPLRHILVWWAIFSLLLNTLFSSSLVSNLTATTYQKPVDTITALLENNYEWSLNKVPEIFCYLSGPISKEGWQRKWTNRFRFSNETSQCRIMQGNTNKLAVLAVDHGYGVLLEEDLNCKHILDGYQTLRNCLEPYRTAFLLPYGSPYLELFSGYITRYRESGLFHKEYRELFHRKTLKEKYIVEVKYPTNINKVDKVKLKLSNTLVIFYLFSMGILISLFVFLLELLWHRKTCNIHCS